MGSRVSTTVSAAFFPWVDLLEPKGIFPKAVIKSPMIAPSWRGLKEPLTFTLIGFPKTDVLAKAPVIGSPFRVPLWPKPRRAWYVSSYSQGSAICAILCTPEILRSQD